VSAAASRWYREPMVWLLVALPLASVVATGVLMRAAGDAGPLDSAPDPVRRSAQVQESDLAADLRALELGIATTARTGTSRGTLRIERATLPAGDLLLELVHPLDASRDRVVEPTVDGATLVVGGFDSRIGWHLRLRPASAQWRLVGRWDPARPDATIALRPALGASAATEPR
jgi:hypothetical protein